MGKGLLAWWRRRIVSRGLAGAALFAVPVAVAALIGFGTSLSGVAGGLTAFTSGPDAVPAAQTTPSKLNNAVAALANRGTRSTGANSGAGGNSDGQGSGPGNGVSIDPGTGNGSGTGGSGSNPTVDVSPTSTTSATPGVNLPDAGGVTNTTTTTTNDTVNQVGGAVNNLVGGVNQTLNNLLGGGGQ
jgi:hypothetical protein